MATPHDIVLAAAGPHKRRSHDQWDLALSWLLLFKTILLATIIFGRGPLIGMAEREGPRGHDALSCPRRGIVG